MGDFSFAIAFSSLNYFCRIKAWPNWTTLLATMSIIILVECWSIFTLFIEVPKLGNNARQKIQFVTNLLLFVLF